MAAMSEAQTRMEMGPRMETLAWMGLQKEISGSMALSMEQIASTEPRTELSVLTGHLLDLIVWMGLRMKSGLQMEQPVLMEL